MNDSFDFQEATTCGETKMMQATTKGDRKYLQAWKAKRLSGMSKKRARDVHDPSSEQKR
jgi:hypothetical protein